MAAPSLYLPIPTLDASEANLKALEELFTYHGTAWRRPPESFVPQVKDNNDVFYHPADLESSDFPEHGQRGWLIGETPKGFTATVVQFGYAQPASPDHTYAWQPVKFQPVNGAFNYRTFLAETPKRLAELIYAYKAFLM